MSKRHAVALRAFTHGEDSFAKNETILNMEPGHFRDWSADGVDLVRAATDAEIAKARGDAAPAKAKPARNPKPAARAKAAPAANTASATIEPTPVADADLLPATGSPFARRAEHPR